MSVSLHPTLNPKYRRFNRRAAHRKVVMIEMKPPYRGEVAAQFGWPRVPPYQLKRRKKMQWLTDYDSYRRPA